MSHLSKKDLERYQKTLIDLRQKVLNRGMIGQVNLTGDDLADESDHAALMIQQNLSVEVQERNRWLLREIENALEKFENSSYGVCEDTGEPIEKPRLDAQPYTRYCVEAAEMREKEAKRYARTGNSGNF